jgi:hypothetical protein
VIPALIGSLLPYVVPIAGIIIVILLQLGPHKPTRPGTSAKPEGRDPHEDPRD